LALAERRMTIADLVADQAELRLLARKEKWRFVPDRIFPLAGVHYCCEWDNQLLFFLIFMKTISFSFPP